MKALEGKVAIVTGGARDIGRAVSEKLADEGARVVVNYFSNPAQGDETVDAIKASGGEAVAIRGDMTEPGEVENLVAEARKAFGESIDVLVNVVGGLVARQPLAEMDRDFFERVMRLNVSSAFLTTQAVAPYMNAGSAIVNFSSQAGRDGGGAGAAAYAASKGAVMTFTRSMAKELSSSGIRVNCVCPGMIATRFHDDFTNDAVRKNVAAATPLQREGEASEVADLVAFLASPASSFMTGNSVDINGGLLFS